MQNSFFKGIESVWNNTPKKTPQLKPSVGLVSAIRAIKVFGRVATLLSL